MRPKKAWVNLGFVFADPDGHKWNVFHVTHHSDIQVR